MIIYPRYKTIKGSALMGKHKKLSRDKKNIKKEYKFVYGIPHSHTSNSTGKGTPIEAFQYAKNNGLDFLVITDHNNYMDEIIKYKDSKMSKWTSLLKSAEKINKKYDNFLALTGFEVTGTPWGHFNFIGTKHFFKGSIKDLNKLVLWLSNNPSIMSINHPGTHMEKLPFNDFLNNYLTLIEVGNGSSGKYSRYEKRYYGMLDKGWKLAAVNSQDNHKINFGDSENLTVALVEKFDKKSLLEAFKKRRTYSTESKTLKFLFKVNNCHMGEIIKCTEGENLKFTIIAEDTKNFIESAEIISSKGEVIKKINFPGEKNIKYLLNVKANIKQNWYVVRLKQQNDKIAISSPVFIKIK